MNLDKLYKNYCFKNPKPMSYTKYLEHKLKTMDQEHRNREVAGVIYQDRFYLYKEAIGMPWLKKSQAVYYKD